MVSVGHTYSKCQDLLKFEFSGEGGVFSQSQNSKSSKCQDLPRFEFSGGGGGGDSPKVKTQNLLSATICLNLNFSQSQKSKCQVLAKFSLSGMGGG